MKKDKIKYSLVTDLSDKELISVLLDPFSIKDEDRENIIKEVLYLLDRNRVIYLSTLKKIEELSEEACHTLLAALEISRRWPRGRGKKIQSSKDAYQEVRHYAAREQEMIIVMALNGAKEILFTEVIALGSASCCHVYARDIFTDAIRSRAMGIIIAHNHPSSSLEVSVEDKIFTSRIAKLANEIGITLLDHLIINEESYISLGKLGLL